MRLILKTSENSPHRNRWSRHRFAIKLLSVWPIRPPILLFYPGQHSRGERITEGHSPPHYHSGFESHQQPPRGFGLNRETVTLRWAAHELNRYRQSLTPVARMLAHVLVMMPHDGQSLEQAVCRPRRVFVLPYNMITYYLVAFYFS